MKSEKKVTLVQKGTGARVKVPLSELPTRSAAEIAADFEAQGKKYLEIAKQLRGKK